MPRKTVTSFEDRELIKRLFFIFRSTSQREMSNLLSISEKILSNWKSGASRPTLDQVRSICSLCKIDSALLLEGKTKSYESIVNFFYPELIVPNNTINPLAYQAIRYWARLALYTIGDKREDALFMMAIYKRASTDPSAMTPEGFYDVPPGTDSELIELTRSKIDLPGVFLKDAQNDFREMRQYTLNPHTFKYKLYAPIENPSIKGQSTRNNNNNTLSIPDDFYKIPYFPDGIAAGNPKEIKEYPDGVVILHKDWCAHPLETSAARLDDSAHSMEPTIMAGSIITVDHAITDPKELDGEVVAIHKNYAGITVKRLKKIGDRWCGIPDNPEYEVIELEEGDSIIGLVTTHHNLISHKR